MDRNALRHATKHAGTIPKKLIFSYIFDWIIIIAFAVVGGALSFVKPNHRNFSLLNLEISQPYVPEQIKTWMLVVIALVAPAVLIAIIALLFVPGSRIRKSYHRSQVVRLKLWELEKGLAGLCLSVAVAFFITQGMKNMFGKPRPDLLARCQPNLDNIAAHVVGGYGQDISARWTLVDSGICTQADQAFLNDGFRSFPSGHSSFSWSGLLYLTLYFCSKFSVRLPHLPLVPRATSSSSGRTLQTQPADQELLPLHLNRARGSSEDTKRHDDAGPFSTRNRTTATTASLSATQDLLSLRNAAASPPNYLLVPALTPLAVAVYICATRYYQFYHFGFDIISGSLIGIVAAWLAFRWYHLPISRGHGWAYGARSRDRAFAIGVGTDGYVGEDEEGGWHRMGDGEAA